uniref:Putative secreted protein n=1 Tax=Anopheles marajoara TaxID=58244 RepID=A0A2M4C6D7_9DIPT
MNSQTHTHRFSPALALFLSLALSLSLCTTVDDRLFRSYTEGKDSRLRGSRKRDRSLAYDRHASPERTFAMLFYVHLSTAFATRRRKLSPTRSSLHTTRHRRRQSPQSSRKQLVSLLLYTIYTCFPSRNSVQFVLTSLARGPFL